MKHGEHDDTARLCDVEDAVGESAGQHATYVAVNQRMARRMTPGVLDRSVDAEQKVVAQAVAASVVLVEGLIDLALGLGPEDDFAISQRLDRTRR